MTIKKLVKELERLTDLNAHTEAAVLIAEYTSNKFNYDSGTCSLLSKAYYIRHQHQLHNSMTMELVVQRTKLIKNCLAHLNETESTLINAVL